MIKDENTGTLQTPKVRFPKNILKINKYLTVAVGVAAEIINN